MGAAPSVLFSSSVQVQPLLLSASSSAVGNSRRRGGRRRGSVVVCCSSTASGPLLLPSGDFDHQVQECMTNVRQTILQESARETMAAVDNLKRLCIDHYFQEEIEDAMAACMSLLHSDDLHDAALALRLMREAGIDVSADDILCKFTDGSGEFNLALSKDIRGLLSLHDLSHLNMGDEASLYKAKEFSTQHLTSAVRYLEPGLARYVRQSLDHPYHLSLMQYKARHHLSYLQSLPKRNTIAMEELAIAEFQLNKKMHQNEMEEFKRWWMDLGLPHEIPVVRDQVLKWYMWAVAILQGSSFSQYRVEITKIISFVYVVDDIFDLVGSPEELSRFSDAIKTWDIAVADSLPAYMRSCYKAIYSATNEIADMARKEHGLNRINYLKKAWAMLLDGFMVEAKWLATDEMPAAEDYLRNGVVTSGVPLVFAHILVLLGHDHGSSSDAAAKKLIDHIPPPVSCPAKILRLHDDMGSAKDEAQEGLDGSYKDLYLLENPSCDVEEHMRSMIAMEWEELNRECFKRRGFSSSFTQACSNAARMVSVMYGYNKEQRLPVLEDYITTLLL